MATVADRPAKCTSARRAGGNVAVLISTAPSALGSEPARAADRGRQQCWLLPRARRLSKGAGKQRCRECVEAAEQAASGQGAANQAAAIEEARRALQQAEIGGSAAATAGAAARLAALEAQKVTGLKPVVLGRGGRGRGRGGGSWRGRGGK